MNNKAFDPLSLDFALKQMKQIQKENEQSLRKIFDKKIKQSFLIDMLHRVTDTMGADVTKYYDLSINKYKKTEYKPVEYPSTEELLADLNELEMEITATLAELGEML